MLILHVIDQLVLTGAETHLLTMLRGAVRAYPFRHHVISIFGDGPVGQRIRALGIPVENLGFEEEIRRKDYLRVASALYRAILRIKPDVIETTSAWSRLLGLPAARWAGVPRRFAFEQGDIFLASWKWRVANRLMQVLPQKIIVCSHALKKNVHELYGISENRLEVLHNCLDTESFGNFSDGNTAGPVLKKSDFFQTDDLTVFCAVGSLGHGINKRVDVPIRALAKLRKNGCKAGLLICGDGPQRTELERLAGELGLSAEVRFLGVRTDVDRIMSVCDAFCHSAPFEPFGIVCIEAMWMGLPALVPSSGGIAEIVQDRVDGFVYPPCDSDELASRMEIICRDPTAAARMGHAAKRKVNEQFSVRPYLERLYGLYNLKDDRHE